MLNFFKEVFCNTERILETNMEFGPKKEDVAVRGVYTYLVTEMRGRISSSKCKHLKLKRFGTTVTNEISLHK